MISVHHVMTSKEKETERERHAMLPTYLFTYLLTYLPTHLLIHLLLDVLALFTMIVRTAIQVKAMLS